MVKLFVDDIRECPEGWTLARTITEAISILSTGYVDIVSLDFDIRACANKRCLNRIETFKPVYEYIALMPNKPSIWIHTGNATEGQKWAKRFGVAWTMYDPFNYLPTTPTTSTDFLF